MAFGSFSPSDYAALNPFASFVTGLTSGAKTMLEISKAAQELKMQIAADDERRAAVAAKNEAQAKSDAAWQQAAPYIDKDVVTSMKPNFPQQTAGTTGSAAGGGGGGGGEPSQQAAQNAQIAADVFRQHGWTDAAIQGAIANGFAESGMGVNAAPGAAGELGAWQFNPKGELPNYQKAYGTDWSIKSQASYIAGWVDQHMPDYKNITDPRAATDQFMGQFERPKDATPGSRYGHLQTASYALGITPSPSFVKAVGGAPAGPQGAPGAAPTATAALPEIPHYAGAFGPQAAAAAPATQALGGYGVGGALSAPPTQTAAPVSSQQQALGTTSTPSGTPTNPSMSLAQYAYQMGQPQAPPGPSTTAQLSQPGGPLYDVTGQRPMALVPVQSSLFG